MQDITVAEDETLRALDDLVTAGKVVYIGCSNYAAYRLMDSPWLAGEDPAPHAVRDAPGAIQPARFARYDLERNWKILDAVRAVAGELGTTPSATSLAWLLGGSTPGFSE